MKNELIKMAKGINDDSELSSKAKELIMSYGKDAIVKFHANNTWLSRSNPSAFSLLCTAIWIANKC